MVEMCKWYTIDGCGYSANPESDGCACSSENECFQAMVSTFIGCPKYVRDDFFDPKPKN